MSLAERWKQYRAALIFINQNDEYASQRAFYAGADAVAKELPADERAEFEAEIDHFRSHKAR